MQLRGLHKLEILTTRQAEILCLHFGPERLSFWRIGEQFGKTREQIAGCVKHSLFKLSFQVQSELITLDELPPELHVKIKRKREPKKSERSPWTLHTSIPLGKEIG